MSESIIHSANINDQIKVSAILPEGGAFVTTVSAEAATKSTNALLNPNDDQSADWAYWGADNNWPKTAREKIEKSTTAYPLIFKMVSLIYGSGVKYYFLETDENGNETKRYKKDENIDEFIRRNRLNRFIIEQLMDFKFFGNAFSEFIFNGAVTSIEEIYHKEAEFSRKSKQNKTTFRFDKLGYYADWKFGAEESIPQIPLLNPTDNTFEKIKKVAQNEKKAAYHTAFPSPGRQAYAMPPHGAIYREKGWLDYSNSIPEILNKMMENQMIIKYHIQIPYSYWEGLYKEWSTWTHQKRQTKIKEKLEEMNDWLTGKTNAGKSFISHYATDPVTKKPLPGWKIEAIEDKTKKDDWIPSAQEADTQITRAIGLDTSMAGIQAQGGKLGAGSGSDKRVGFINTVNLSKAEMDILFEPLYVVRDFNKWPSNLHFEFIHHIPTTLDNNPVGSEKQA